MIRKQSAVRGNAARRGTCGRSRRRLGHVERDGTVDHAVAVLVHQRRDGARLTLELHEAVARPAALEEELVHQEARGNVAAVAAEVLTEGFPGALLA